MRLLSLLSIAAVLTCSMFGVQADRAQEAFNELLSSLIRSKNVTDLIFDKGLVEEMRAYGWQRCVEQPDNQKDYWLALVLLGDPDARPLIVNELVRNPNQPAGWDLATSGVPTLLPDLAPAMFHEEKWADLGYGSNVGEYPASFKMAALIVRLLGRSPSFGAEVINWARRFGERPEVYEEARANEMRDIMREWWKVNEEAIRNGNYSAVIPGRDPTPLPEPELPVAVPVVTSSPAATLPAATTAIPAVLASERRTALLPWVIGFAAVVVILRFVWKLRVWKWSHHDL